MQAYVAVGRAQIINLQMCDGTNGKHCNIVAIIVLKLGKISR